MKTTNTFLLLLFTCLNSLFSQNIDYARSVIDTLSSPGMHGRGYVNNGDKIAANFIGNEYQKANLKSFTENYFQEFSFPINTFPDSMALRINGIVLMPGKDFVVAPASGSCNGTFDVMVFDNAVLQNKKKLNKFKQSDFRNKIIIVDDAGVEKEADKAIFNAMAENPFKAAGVLILTDNKFTWSMSTRAHKHPVIMLQRKAMPAIPKTISANIKNRFLYKYASQNVIGYVEGTEEPDSFIVFTAHYDHLGRMGTNTYFPGANDNASGTAMILDLANHYNNQPSKYSIVFMAFSAEEVGLIGSEHYTNNPLFPLEKIKILVNLDMMGNGEEGVTVVNATLHDREFKNLVKLNTKNSYLKEVFSRGKAANSDHYHFSEKGVKAFFIYTMGGSKAYHDVYDVPAQLTLTKYEDVFRLLRDFVGTID